MFSNGVSLADIAAVTGNNRDNDGMWGNGAWWIVRPNSEELRRSDGVYTLGVTDGNTKTVSIARGMSDYMTNKVLCHELVHCYSFSYDCHIDMPIEEIIADFMSLYGRDIIYLADDILHNVLEKRYG